MALAVVRLVARAASPGPSQAQWLVRSCDHLLQVRLPHRALASRLIDHRYAYSMSRFWKASAPTAAIATPSRMMTAAAPQSGFVAGASLTWVKTDESRSQS